MDVSTAPPALVQVISGDTLRIGAERIRILNIDAPDEDAGGQCDSERFLARHATKAMLQIVARARDPVLIARSGTDRFGRTLARVTIAGQDIGEQMIALGFAVPWKGRASRWCYSPSDD